MQVPFPIVCRTAVRACAAPAFPSRTALAQRYLRLSSNTVTECFASKGVVHPESSSLAVTPPKARPSRTERTSYRAFGGAITRTAGLLRVIDITEQSIMPCEVRLRRANPSQGPVPGCCHVPNGKKESEARRRSRSWRNHRTCAPHHCWSAAVRSRRSPSNTGPEPIATPKRSSMGGVAARRFTDQHRLRWNR